ncbi:site-2 protease family protein [Desulfovulcanus ferrireducens]|uniref:site-2 protease family protein n=1 Tax=Desulfovulcanus ferrireducens TaxID=2831190 RepID=UPI00207BB95A|nr:site-2 protease family protein [Desulfovulcanus ferrireducens]
MFDISIIIKELAIFSVPLLLGITCHEVAHGYVAYLLGDPTAKNAGRLTLNPLKHLDPIGTLVLILTRRIGWAKPVPINPAYFKNLRRDILLVSLAGPAANLVLALIFFLLFKLVNFLSPFFSTQLNQVVFAPMGFIFSAGTLVNVILAVFNLIPIPPLDGSKIIASFLPSSFADKYMSLEKFGFLILIILVFTGVFQKMFSVIVTFVYNLIFS